MTRECISHSYACDCREAKFAEMEKDAADARRYRQIRKGLSENHGDVYAMVFAPDGDFPVWLSDLDQAIDAAMQKEGEG